MDVIAQSKITTSDLSAQRGNVLVKTEIELHRGAPEAGHSILAGIWLPDGDGPGRVQVVTIEYHVGRKCWHLVVEHSRNQANEYHPGTLPDIISTFETRFGVELPPVKMIHLGVGVYPAKSSYASENPWALVNGSFYTVTDPARGKRTFVADVRNGRTLISFVTTDDTSETFEPELVLSAADWRSLAPAA